MSTPETHPTTPTHPGADTPLVSVMVPVYNVERYLPQCLDSILAQDYQNLDVLLVDDGSTDGCGTLCDSCASHDSRVRVVHTENQGLAAARNVCLAHTRADLPLFVDADEWIEPNTVSTLVGTINGVIIDRANQPDPLTHASRPPARTGAATGRSPRGACRTRRSRA